MKKNPEHFDLQSIQDPAFVKKLSKKETDLLCSDIREELIRITSTYGGHLSSNLGAVELTVALHKVFNFPEDKLIFDVGHQSYTHKILTGRSLEHLNAKGGISGFQKIKESIYDCYESGHSSNSLSAAEAFAIKRDADKENYNVVAVIGDGSVVNGLSFEALNDIADRHHKVIIVINDNDMSISHPVGGLSNFFRKISTGSRYNRFKAKVKTSNTRLAHFIYRKGSVIKDWIKSKLIRSTMFEDMGYVYIGTVDGHDVPALCDAFRRAKNVVGKSVIIHVLTQKGKGYPFAEFDKSGAWHEVAPFNPQTGLPLETHPESITWSALMSGFMDEAMKNHPNLVSVVPATLKGSGLEEVYAHYPDRCFDVGIAEEHALTLSGALYLNGYHPIVSIYSTFFQRAFDELCQDCARFRADMTILIERAGLVGKNGETHQGIFDEAYLKAVPNLTLTMPSTPEEAKALFDQSLEKGHGIYCIRLIRGSLKKEGVEPLELTYGKWLKVRQESSKKAVCVTFGPHLNDLLSLANQENTDLAIYNALYLSIMDEEAVKDIMCFNHIVIYDPYGTKEGFAMSLASTLMEKGYRGQVHIKAIPNAFIQQATVNEQEEDLDLKPSQVFDFVKTL